MVEEIIIRAIEGLEEELKKGLKKLRHFYPHHHRLLTPVRQVLTIFLNNQTFIIMNPLSLVVGAGEYPILSALTDALTGAAHPEAVATPVSATSDTPAVAAIGADGSLQPVAPGTGNLIVVNSWDYTDSNTGKAVTGLQLTTTQPFAVTQTAEGVLQVVTLGPPVPIPAVPAS